ncbi:prolyl aminopeptidase [Pseudomonas sp. SWRI153]|uniref:Proline iminopeptidase n=1 Tax=Pseudomonas khorasanensis TaxID=2745508 RepID=A0A923EZD4_9PSED|nr:prolyl aminopeptidase [Pseudomonas khorasanensis]MBV4484583.1 prolyl aminopeptidase [Pseudomonas khorasanensis]
MEAPREVTYNLFPAIEEPRRSGMLEVDEIHTLYWEESGNPDGVPVVYLHGGPGEGAPPGKRQFWDPDYYRIVLFDQRGALRSTPLGELRNNTTQALVDDLEKLREHLNIESWLITGGSWGTTLALAYGDAHPQRCLGFILRGIFLGTEDEIDWFIHGMRRFFPRAHEDFVNFIPEEEREDLLQAYLDRMTGDDEKLSGEAIRGWVRYSASCSLLRHDPDGVEEQAADEQTSTGMGRLDVWYFKNRLFLEEDQLINNIEAIKHLPCKIIQGGHDMIATPNSAFRLHKAWPDSVLKIINDAGHSPSEPGIISALIEATEQFKESGKFC